MGSNSGFHTGERCRPQSRFMDSLFLMCMASIVLLFQYPMAVAWTLAAPQSMECCVFCTCTAIPFLGSPVFTAYLCSVKETVPGTAAFVLSSADGQFQGVHVCVCVCIICEDNNEGKR